MIEYINVIYPIAGHIKTKRRIYMKKILSVFLVAAMLVAVLATVACGNEPEATTTTLASTDATTTTTEATTEATTTTSTTTTQTTTTTETTTTAETTTTIFTEPVFARFDFGTKTYAEDNNLTSHEYITSHLTYNKTYISVTYDEDNIIVTSLLDYNYNSSMKSNGHAFSLLFDDISADYTFEDPQEIHAGMGKNGYHQYMKIRFVNGSPNTKISFDWKSTSLATWYKTAVCAMDVTPGKASADYDEYQVAIFDVAREVNLPTGASEITDDNGVGPGNNWIWQGASQFVTAIRFGVLASYVSGTARSGATFATTGSNAVDDGTGKMIASDGSGKVTSWTAGEELTAAKVAARCDTRGLIKKGNFVKIDYIVFGVSPEQLMEYKSNLERASES